MGAGWTARVSHRNMVDVPVRALESREGEPGSLGRLARASVALAEGLELSAAQREALDLGAPLHDIGEIRIPEAVPRKPGPLAAEARLVVQTHPASGVEILEVVLLPTQRSTSLRDWLYANTTRTRSMDGELSRRQGKALEGAWICRRSGL